MSSSGSSSRGLAEANCVNIEGSTTIQQLREATNSGIVGGFAWLAQIQLWLGGKLVIGRYCGTQPQTLNWMKESSCWFCVNVNVDVSTKYRIEYRSLSSICFYSIIMSERTTFHINSNSL